MGNPQTSAILPNCFIFGALHRLARLPGIVACFALHLIPCLMQAVGFSSLAVI